MSNRNVILANFDVVQCPGCGGDHQGVRFEPGDGPTPEETHWFSCPKTGAVFWMNTYANPGSWESMLNQTEMR